MTAILAALCSFAGDPTYPQFPSNDRVLRVMRLAEDDESALIGLLYRAGAQDECEHPAGITTRTWAAVPWYCRDNHEMFKDAQVIRIAWTHLFGMTHPDATAELRQTYKEDLIKLIGEDWFERGVMPIPLSMGGGRLVR